MPGRPVLQTVIKHKETQPASILNEHDDVFNYELVQLRYMEACKEYFKSPKNTCGPWTQAMRIDIINSIKSHESIECLKKYQVVLYEGEEKLVCAGTALEVLTYEESFDIFVEAHQKAGHGGFNEVMKRLEKTFEVNGVFLTFFLENCNICKRINLQHKQVVDPLEFNDCVVIEILKAPIQDLECRYILFYKEYVTKFLLIRPLTAIDEYEIAIEMLKIFTDFGPPLLIRTLHAPLFNNVLTILERGGFGYDIAIQPNIKVISESFVHLMQEIVARTNEDNKFWSTTCRFVQVKHNHGQLMPDPTGKKKLSPFVRPFTQLFLKDKGIKHSVSEIQEESQEIKPSCSTDKFSNIIQGTENCVIDSISSEIGEDDEIEELQSVTHMEIEKILKRSRLGSNLNVTKYYSSEGTESPSLCNSIADDIDDIEVMPESDPLETPPLTIKSEDKLTSSNITEVKSDAGDTTTSKTIDSLKEGPQLGEKLTSGSVHTKGILKTRLEQDLKTPHKLSVGILRTKRKTVECTEEESNNDSCSMCKGKMYTDFFCYGCKKRTHIFCLTRVTIPLARPNATVKSFTYCRLCVKTQSNTHRTL